VGSSKTKAQGDCRFFIDDLPVVFPYDFIYPEQYAYMVDLKKTIDSKVAK
jgi:hypothetical protein